jgi:hypothetical protein
MMARGSARQRRSAASGRSSTCSGSCARTRSRRRRGICPCTSCPASACRGASSGTLQGQCGVFKPSAANIRARALFLLLGHTKHSARTPLRWNGRAGVCVRSIAPRTTTARSATPCRRSKAGGSPTGDGEARFGEGRRDVVLARVGLGLPAPANSEVRRNTLRQTIGAARLRERAANE